MQVNNGNYGQQKYVSRPRRPVDKEITVQSDIYGTTQVTSTIHTSTVAETFSGGHLSGFVGAGTGTTPNIVLIALCYVKEGQSVPTLSITDGSSIEPASSVLWSKMYRLLAASQVLNIDSDDRPIKTMRKMQKGDSLVLTGICTVSSGASIALTTTFFYKQ